MKLALFAVVLMLFFATGVITLLGIVQRVAIERKYLNALFSALILELIAAVLFLFSATDFFAGEPLTTEQSQTLAVVEQYYPGLSSLEFEQRVAAEREQLNEQALQSKKLATADSVIMDLQAQLTDFEDQLAAKEQQLKWLQDELITRNQAVVRLSQLERQFLVRMSELNSKIGQWGTSINFQWQPDGKREIALMLQEAFKEIGFMPALEIPNDDPLLTHQIMVRYQQAKEFKEIGFLTPQVIAFIIQDYLRTTL